MIEAVDLTVQSGPFRLERINCRIEPGAYCVLMGRTGSGKTTFLEAICGLKTVVSGTIRLGDRDVTRVRTPDRGIGFVPQDGALFPTMTVRQHLEFALRIRKWAHHELHERVAEVAEMVGVAHLLSRYPAGLSGGETQRVALGRALSFGPPVLCLDEPLSSLDDESRNDLIDLLRQVHAEWGLTALHVTHNLEEAERLASQRLVISSGRISSPSDNGKPVSQAEQQRGRQPQQDAGSKGAGHNGGETAGRGTEKAGEPKRAGDLSATDSSC